MSFWTQAIFEKFTAGAQWADALADSFEPRSIVLTLQELADKTPAGEPLLITQREWRAYAEWQKTRAVKNTGGVPLRIFNGRELLLIDESRVLPNLEDTDKTLVKVDSAQQRIFNLAFALQQLRNPKGFVSDTDLRELKLSIDNTPINQLAQVEAGLRQMVDQLTTARKREAAARFVGERAAVVGEALFLGARDLNAARMRAFFEQLPTRGDVPPEAKVSELAFREWAIAEFEKTETSGGGKPAARGTERNIPVGVPRGYFEE